MSSSKKIFVRYEDPGGRKELDTALRVTLPGKWSGRGCGKVVDMFVDAYNAKHKDHKLKASDVALYGDKSRQEIRKDVAISEGLKDEETVWIRTSDFQKTPETRELTDYTPRMLAKKDDLETMRRKNQDVLIDRASQVLSLFALPSDEDATISAVRRVIDERTEVETLICGTPHRVYELTTLILPPNPLDDYADALGRAWTQLGTILKRRNLRVGPYLPLKGEYGKVLAKMHGRRWLCSFYKRREPLNKKDAGADLGKILGKLHSVARINKVAAVAAQAATLPPRPWREEVLHKDRQEEILGALRIPKAEADVIFDDLPTCWNHTDFRTDWCATLHQSSTTKEDFLLPSGDEKASAATEKKMDVVYVVDGCCDGREKPRVVDLLSFFTDLVSLPKDDETDAKYRERRLQALFVSCEAYVKENEWLFSVDEIRTAPMAWKLAAQFDADVLADLDDVYVDIQKILRDATPIVIREGPVPEEPDETKSDTSSDYGEPPISPAPPDDPEPEEFWARIIWHDKYPTRYDLLRQKLVKKTEESIYEDIFMEHHVKRAPVREKPDNSKPMVYSSNLQEGDIDSPRPMFLDYIPTVPLRWQVASIVILLLRDRDRQENVWDTILAELPSVPKSSLNFYPSLDFIFIF